jgi:beta-phosphoglucomutase
VFNNTAPLSEKYTGCLFDFDGVIVDSEPVHAEAKKITLDHFGIDYPESIFSDFKGRPDSVFFEYISEELSASKFLPGKLHAFKSEVYLELFNNVKLIDGIIPFLELSKFKFNTLGMATSATIHDLNLLLNKYNLSKYFSFIVTGDDTIKHKPYPEPFIKALALSGRSSSEIFIIEDSPNGIIAGKAAGCFVVGITTSFSKEILFTSGADIIVDDYMELAEKL